MSLDSKIVELKSAGSLLSLCKQDPGIKECQDAIGEWKPEQLERAKMQAPSCFDKCMLDVFGFYRDFNSGRDIPAVRTKDFDASAPSRGFEVTLYPVAAQVFRYEGCAGCELVLQYPISLQAQIGKVSYELPILARGGYYLPSTFRRAILDSPGKDFSLYATTSEGSYSVEISKKAADEYRRMLRVLEYDKVH
jgi:hypothetical protein